VTCGKPEQFLGGRRPRQRDVEPLHQLVVRRAEGLPHADAGAGDLEDRVLGAFQVSATGDLANWHTGAPDAIPAVGGAMDLATGAKDVYVMMSLFAKDGTPKLVPECSYPLTGVGCVTRVYTNDAVFLLSPEGVRVRETFGTTLEELQSKMDIKLLPPTE